MIEAIRNWLKKKLGQQVCEEWTQWEAKHGTFERNYDYDLFDRLVHLDEPIVTTRRWQERRCTLCGFIEQRDLEQ